MANLVELKSDSKLRRYIVDSLERNFGTELGTYKF